VAARRPHYDRVGVLAFVMDQIRRAGINIEEVQNVIFEGAAAASCRIQLDAEPAPICLGRSRRGTRTYGDRVVADRIWVFTP